jgi:hypothetical protein
LSCERTDATHYIRIQSRISFAVKIRLSPVAFQFAILVRQPLLAVRFRPAENARDNEGWLPYKMRSVAFLEIGGVGSQLSPR